MIICYSLIILCFITDLALKTWVLVYHKARSSWSIIGLLIIIIRVLINSITIRCPQNLPTTNPCLHWLVLVLNYHTFTYLLESFLYLLLKLLVYLVLLHEVFDLLLETCLFISLLYGSFLIIVNTKSLGLVLEVVGWLGAWCLGGCIGCIHFYIIILFLWANYFSSCWWPAYRCSSTHWPSSMEIFRH